MEQGISKLLTCTALLMIEHHRCCGGTASKGNCRVSASVTSLAHGCSSLPSTANARAYPWLFRFGVFRWRIWKYVFIKNLIPHKYSMIEYWSTASFFYCWRATWHVQTRPSSLICTWGRAWQPLLCCWCSVFSCVIACSNSLFSPSVSHDREPWCKTWTELYFLAL